MFAGHLEKQVFCMGFAVNVAGSISDLNLLCGHGSGLLKKF
jgi:hypothetical protein